MLQNLLSLILCLTLFSCQITPPETAGGSGTVKTNLRNISVLCTLEDHCEATDDGEQEMDDKVYALYTTDECINIDTSSPLLAVSSKKLHCDQAGCSSYLKDFVDPMSVILSEDPVVVDDGKYTLAVFVDLNESGLPDLGEPFYCNDEVEINPGKRLIVVSVLIDRVF